MDNFKQEAAASVEGHEYSNNPGLVYPAVEPAASQPSCSFSYPAPAFPQPHPMQLPPEFYYISPLRHLLYPPAVDPAAQHFNSHQFVPQQALRPAVLPPSSSAASSRCSVEQANSRLLPTENITSGPSAKLTETALWRQFAEVGNEMIVTKPGR